MVYVIVQAESAVLQGHVAGVVPVRDVHLMVDQQGAHGFAQQGGEMPGQGGDQQHLGLPGAAVLAKVQQRAKRRCERDFFRDRQLMAGHHHRLDAVRRAAVRQPQA